MTLSRPLAFFDLETTGTNITNDRIVELSMIKLLPDGSRQTLTRRVNPGIPIPPQATAVHHITNDDVANEPTFAQIAPEVLAFLDNCDIAGFNSNKFDVPVLIEELGRAGLDFDIKNRHFIDVQNIFHKMEPRTLVAAYRFYCNKELVAAHSALGDTEATVEVFLSQLRKYPDIGQDVEALSKFSSGSKNIDLMGRFCYNDKKQPVFNFGKHKGKPVAEVFDREPSYFRWMMDGDFSKNTKDVLQSLYYQFQASKKC